MDARGETSSAVDDAQVEGIVRDLVESGVEAITVGLVNSYVSTATSGRSATIVERLYPGFPVTLSSHVLPEFREYERTLTACMNSYVRPKVADLRAPAGELAAGARRARDVNILRSDAGLMTTTEAQRNPIYGVLSGPVRRRRRRALRRPPAGYPNILTFDMGGTSTDVALCQNGEPTIGRETSIGHFRVKVPSVNVHTVGAGGGSIAHVPQLTGALRVGPQSAGAEPGPAAYGKGGTEPTVTDANVVLGHLPPRLLGGEMALDVEAARAAVQTIADAMGLSLEEAAEGILAIVNENMAGALRARLRAARPRPARLRAGRLRRRRPAARERGGEADGLVPGHRAALARPAVRGRRPRGRVPQRVRADPHPPGPRRRRTRSRTSSTSSAAARATGWTPRASPRRDQRLTYVADMRYHRQGYEIPVALEPATVRADGLGDLAERFNALHEQLYGFRMHARARDREPARGRLRRRADARAADRDRGRRGPSGAVVEEHAIVFEGEQVPTRIYDRTKLRPGARIAGPAIVTEFDSTTVVLPGYRAEVDSNFNILINPGA